MGAALVAALVAGGATPAQAVPSNCTLTSIPKGGKVKCTTGTGEVRVYVTCIILKPGDPIENTIYGPWVGVGATSQKTCGGGSQATDIGYQVR
jgi:hypothetical protein